MCDGIEYIHSVLIEQGKKKENDSCGVFYDTTKLPFKEKAFLIAQLSIFIYNKKKVEEKMRDPDKLSDYNLLWDVQSQNSGESMPLGGRDIGCNVWVENNEILIYMAQSGAFDEFGNMLKAGRLRLKFDPNVFEDGFRQELLLEQGCIRIQGTFGGEDFSVTLWNEIYRSALHIEIQSTAKIACTCQYENWRDRQVKEQDFDSVFPQHDKVVFYHRNQGSFTLESKLKQQGIEHLKPYFPDVEKNRTSGGCLFMESMAFEGTRKGEYLTIPYLAYCWKTENLLKNIRIDVYFHISQAQNTQIWESELQKKIGSCGEICDEKKKALQWWSDFWKRSYVYVDPFKKAENTVDWQVGRNYQLFRYMQASNAYGEFPTKFNGGLFTVDPCVWHASKSDPTDTADTKLNPDYRDWGGAMFTAQNQRLVYWPMIKNGDFDMMKPTFEFYRRLVEPIKQRTKYFFGLENCACYCEQLDINGLSGYYGFYGVDYPLQVRHHYVEALEFSYMLICYHKVSGNDIMPYLPFICSVLNFYEQKYSELDGKGKRILFPSTALETYHGENLIPVYGEEGRRVANYNDQQTAVTNPADIIAALCSTVTELLSLNCLDTETTKRYQKFLKELPPIPTEIKKGKEVVAPCEFPKEYKKGNCELPQLNTVYPYRSFGVFSDKEALDLAVRTYFYCWDEEDQLDYVSWHVNGCYAARIGLTEEAVKYMRLKLGDSGRKFPAFWGPGHDYTPDHNWGGSGMIGVQEMLMQTFENKIYLLPAWPKNLDVCFQLWADSQTKVRVEYLNGKMEYEIFPKEREKDFCIIF